MNLSRLYGTNITSSSFGSSSVNSFWKFVDNVQWPKSCAKKDTSCAMNQLRKKIATNYKLDDILRFQRVFLRLHRKLQEHIQTVFKGRYVQDSIIDAISHVISRGKKAYQTAMKSPKLVIKFSEQVGSFPSNFGYLFHFFDDYAMGGPDTSRLGSFGKKAKQDFVKTVRSLKGTKVTDK